MSHQSWPGLQQTPLGKHQSEIANHRPGKPDMLSQHTSTKLDMLSQHAKCRQAIPACIAEVTVYKGLHRAQNNSQAVGVRRTQYRGLAQPTLQHFRKLGKA